MKAWEWLPAVAEIAAQQHGAVGVDQLRALDVSPRVQRRATDSGQFVLAHPRVLTVAGSPETWEQSLQVGLLALGPASWVSHAAAAALHNLDRFGPGALDFTVPRARRGPFDSGRVHTTAMVGHLDVVTARGFRCSSATRTIIDLAGVDTSELRLSAAIDSAVRLGLTAPAILLKRLDALRSQGRHGTRTLDRLLIDGGVESMLERKCLAILRRHALPRPTTQARIERSPGMWARVDFLFEPHGLVIEVSGRLGHSSSRERQADAQRRNELTDLGFTVFEYTWQDVTERPDHVASSMRARLCAAGWSQPPSR
ncbi:hypothetical protein BH24ACT5_BH24ACT5_11850 [soil metagenome]